MIDAPLAAFLEGGVAIHLGTRSDALEPNGARAIAVHVSADGAELIVYIAAIAAERLLPDLASNRQATVVFVRPTDDRACQVKGAFIDVRPADEEEHALVDAQWKGFLDHLERIGIPRATSARWVTWPALAVRIRTTAVFDQTPGANAGAQLV
jgi:hypothetical protein